MPIAPTLFQQSKALSVADISDRLGKLLLQRGLLDDFGLRRAMRATEQSGEGLDKVLLSLGLCPESAIVVALSELTEHALAQASDYPDEPLAAYEGDGAFLAAHHHLPVRQEGEGIVVVTADPLATSSIASLAFLLAAPIRLLLATRTDIAKHIDRLYGPKTGKELDQGLLDHGPGQDDGDSDIRRLHDMASEAPVIRLAHTLITRASELGASDIHIEPREDSVRIRYRIDGMLQTVETLPLTMRAAISSRIKIMAQLNIAERRLPQDGRIKLSVRGQDLDLRISTMPTLYGESIVMRLLDRSSINLDFATLGFSGAALAAFNSALEQPNGIILVTGPTGSGKTTTLYTALNGLNDASRKVFTVEDPIEYQLAGVNQIQVNSKIGLTFATALRSILRQDPDIVMVGEIRDRETAEMAVRASLTGHLVLSTLHTNDAASTISRLLDMGVEDYLLASCLKGILAQRLVRRLCPGCATPAPAPPGLVQRLLGRTVNEYEISQLKQPCGCPACRGTGFAGRTTIFEYLPISAVIKDAIVGSPSERKIKDAATADNMKTMLCHGVEKALAGETTLEEVLKAAGGV